MDMRSATREGDQRTLNVWTTSFSKVTFTGGYSQYPWDYHLYPKEDGITIRHDFLYGSKHHLFNDGRYLTHETGHWLGLYHTFEVRPLISSRTPLVS
jgi:Pregnancy-associated plasma protein-A